MLKCLWSKVRFIQSLELPRLSGATCGGTYFKLRQHIYKYKDVNNTINS